MGVLFAIFTAIAAFGIGNTVQANAIATLAQNTYHISPVVSGCIICGLTAAVLLGGVKSIAVCGILVPFMAILYVLGCIYILFVNGHYVLASDKIDMQLCIHDQIYCGRNSRHYGYDGG